MLVYRDSLCTESTADWMAELARDLERALEAPPQHEQARALLIRAGELESAVADALCPNQDRPHPVTDQLRRLTLGVAHLLLAAWRGQTVPMSTLAALRQARDALPALPLPPQLTVKRPEGYAYYNLYPETYSLATEAFLREQRPEALVCIGLRSIGTGLSAVVAAALERHGLTVGSTTLRPRGQPQERMPCLHPRLAAAWRAHRRAHFLLVDEGPGLSGSSLAGCAEALSRLGIPDSHIVLLPAWQPDPSRLGSALARARWPRHRVYTGAFEQVWSPPAQRLRNISAGRWRRLFYADASAWPPVQPQHERRKYLEPDRCGRPARLHRFVGLGRLGEARFERAQRLAAAGFGPVPEQLKDGFLARGFTPGLPLQAGMASAPLLTTAARYLAFLRSHFGTARAAATVPLVQMLEHNCRLGLGLELPPKRRRALLDPALADAAAVALDGRMLPHEWLQTATGYLKVDALDHHDDHFFPGCHDIAWDLAGFSLEFGLDRGGERALLDQYIRFSGDRQLRRRLPFYRSAYLAFRLGYVTLAQQALGPGPEADRFASLAMRYRALLRRELYP